MEWLKGETEEYETDITDKRELLIRDVMAALSQIVMPTPLLFPFRCHLQEGGTGGIRLYKRLTAADIKGV